MSFCTWFLFAGASLFAKPLENPIVLAAQLARDGEISRAQSVLNGVEESEMGDKRVLYLVTKGLVHLQKKEGEQALQSFMDAESSFQEGNDDVDLPTIRLYIARCLLLLERSKEALGVLEQCDQSKRATNVLRIEAHKKEGEWGEAWSAQQQAESLFNQDIEIRIQGILISSKLGLLMEVRDGVSFFTALEAPTEDHILRISSGLRSDGHREMAAMFLELGRHRFFSEDLWRASAVVELERGEWRNAGDILAILSTKDPTYATEAAQAYLQSGDLDKALRYNSFAPRSKDKMQQRLSILLQREEYDLIPVLEQQISNWSLLSQDSVRYGLAYAHFKRGSYQEAKGLLSGISDPKIFRQAVALQRAIAQCSEGGCL